MTAESRQALVISGEKVPRVILESSIFADIARCWPPDSFSNVLWSLAAREIGEYRQICGLTAEELFRGSRADLRVRNLFVGHIKKRGFELRRTRSGPA